MEDPLLSAVPGGQSKSNLNTNQATENYMSKAITYTKPSGDDESSLGLNLGFNGMGIDEESQSVRALADQQKKQAATSSGVTASKPNKDDSDKEDMIVGTDTTKKNKKKDKKKKKIKSASSSDDESRAKKKAEE
jgi:hypothetical protein